MLQIFSAVHALQAHYRRPAATLVTKTKRGTNAYEGWVPPWRLAGRLRALDCSVRLQTVPRHVIHLLSQLELESLLSSLLPAEGALIVVG